MAREVFNPEATDGDGDGMIQDGTVFERPASEVDPKEIEENLVEVPVEEPVVVEQLLEEAPAEAIMSPAKPAKPAKPSLNNAADSGAFVSAAADRKDASKPTSTKASKKVAIYSARNLRWEGLGSVTKGYNFVEESQVDKWLEISYIRLADVNEIKGL